MKYRNSKKGRFSINVSLKNYFVKTNPFWKLNKKLYRTISESKITTKFQKKELSDNSKIFQRSCSNIQNKIMLRYFLNIILKLKKCVRIYNDKKTFLKSFQQIQRLDIQFPKVSKSRRKKLNTKLKKLS